MQAEDRQRHVPASAERRDGGRDLRVRAGPTAAIAAEAPFTSWATSTRLSSA